MSPTPELIDFARELAAAARRETLPRWRDCCAAENKAGAGFDPVTAADREAERAMRDLIAARFPDHGVSGEEWPDRPAEGPFSWSLDPVDGTRAFICRLPTWVTLVALLDGDRPILGLIDAPCLDETYVGAGDAAFIESAESRAPIRASRCEAIAEARLSTTDPDLFTGGERDGFERVRRDARVVRYGHDGYAYARLAAGSIDLVIESGLKPHDYNALIPLVSAAGGTIGDWQGGQDFGDGRLVAAATARLYEQAVAYLGAA